MGLGEEVSLKVALVSSGEIRRFKLPAVTSLSELHSRLRDVFKSGDLTASCDGVLVDNEVGWRQLVESHSSGGCIRLSAAPGWMRSAAAEAVGIHTSAYAASAGLVVHRGIEAVTMSGVTCATAGGITHVIENGTRSLDVAHGSEVVSHHAHENKDMSACLGKQAGIADERVATPTQAQTAALGHKEAKVDPQAPPVYSRTDAIDGRLRWDASVAALMECMRCSFDEALQVWRQVEDARYALEQDTPDEPVDAHAGADSTTTPELCALLLTLQPSVDADRFCSRRAVLIAAGRSLAAAQGKKASSTWNSDSDSESSSSSSSSSSNSSSDSEDDVHGVMASFTA